MTTSLPNWVKRLTEVMVMAAAYYLVGRLGLLLAIPPGYATAVWPASGIALAGTLLFGYRIWPGILLGSFLINVWTSLDTTSTESILNSIRLASSIGMGASLQAIVGAFLVRRFAQYPTALAKLQDVIKFLLLGGPISSLVNSTWGATSLLLGGVIQWADYPFHWWTWWVGDAIGVITFTPLVLIWAAKPQEVSLRRQISVSVPLALTFVLVVILFVYTRAWEQNRINLEFKGRTDKLAQAIKENFDDYVEVLHSIESFYASSVEVDRQEFKNFVSRMRLRHPGVQALSWNPRVLDGQRTAYEQAARRDGFSNFQITERNLEGQLVGAAPRHEYVSVYYLEPYAGNESALGFDVASDPSRHEALNRSRDTGQPAATDPTTLVQDIERELGFLVFLPIYANGLLQNTLEERRQNLQGYVTGAFRISDMIDASLKGVEARDIEIRLYDDTGGETKRLLYDHRSQALESKGLPVETEQVMKPAALQSVIPFEVAGRQWLVQFAPTKEYLIVQRSWQAWSVLAGGLLFTGLLGAFLLVVTGHAAELQAINRDLQGEITQRNLAEASLRESEARKGAILESALDCIVTMDHKGKIVEFNPAAEKIFGYSRAEVTGKPMSDVMIPPSLRERHRRGLAHYLSTGESSVLGKRIEIIAMRADGTEFPVELSITRIPGSEPPLFTGFIRDITERKKAEEALQARYQELLTLHETSQAILISPDLRTTLEKVLDKAVSSGSFDLGIIRLFDPSTQTIQPIVHQGYRDLENVQRHHERSIAATTGRFSTSVLADRQPRIEENVAQCEGLRTFKREGVQSALVIPVMTEEEVLGVLQLGSRTPRKFHPNEIRLAETVGNQIGIAVQKARLYEETQDNLERIRALHEIDRAISSTLDLNATLVVLQKSVPKFVPSIVASTVRLMDEGSGRLEPASCWNLSEDEWRAHVRAGRMTLADKVFDSQRPLKILNVEKDSAQPADFARKYGLTSYLGVPLSAKEERLGVLGLYTKEQHEFTAQEVEFLNTLAGQAAIAIHNARLFEETKKQAIELEKSNKVKDEFLGVISHELRTPLNIISGYTTLLQDETLGEVQAEQQDALKKIEGQSRELLMMVDSVLDVTLLDARREPLANNEVNFDALLSEVRADCAVLTQKKVDIVWNYAPDLPEVKADSKKLKHILRNLIHNAVKFTQEGQITISAKLRDKPANGAALEPQQPSVGGRGNKNGAGEKWLEFKVTDTGVGIPSEALSRIFDRFYQVDSSDTRNFGGMGLGLYIVKQFTELLGGSIEAESALGKGSTFTVTLPVTPPASSGSEITS